ncbi:hypothetical protein PHYSODRAFT_308495 [Phytophthora sojae]|uniref:Uncharacterized protein n=1 Tax=Phytophthora sojae (strain P6497) TaxID=1094619 RepID=G4YEU2_PHYSP|nr:hypothetical protein PHYSODRAFT_308495 [Phytophthora sojae]EGZ26936.1 hypothetical protein PHYSODRAFT_308495 [Phytophthora sojae]|eukprot:XP_009514211.1 hypothetical protein PHYSODRAFT_308495 [Phytophthora sojae]
MVLTRAQARAAAQVPQGEGAPLEIVEGVVTEVPDAEQLAVVPSLAEAQNARVEYQVTRLVDNFWSETQRLAAETTMLHTNQALQAEEYRVALAAVHDDARNSAAQLAAHQEWIEGQIQQALEHTRETLQQELRVVANAHAAGDDSTRRK